MKLEKLDWQLTVCKPASLQDADLDDDVFFLARTDGELSLVCRTRSVPSAVSAREDGWKAFRVQGPLDFSLIGILARISGILAERGISIFAVSTYDTDYVLTREEDFERAAAALAEAGYELV